MRYHPCVTKQMTQDSSLRVGVLGEMQHSLSQTGVRSSVNQGGNRLEVNKRSVEGVVIAIRDITSHAHLIQQRQRRPSEVTKVKI